MIVYSFFLLLLLHFSIHAHHFEHWPTKCLVCLLICSKSIGEICKFPHDLTRQFFCLLVWLFGYFHAFAFRCIFRYAPCISCRAKSVFVVSVYYISTEKIIETLFTKQIANLKFQIAFVYLLHTLIQYTRLIMKSIENALQSSGFNWLHLFYLNIFNKYSWTHMYQDCLNFITNRFILCAHSTIHCISREHTLHKINDT